MRPVALREIGLVPSRRAVGSEELVTEVLISGPLGTGGIKTHVRNLARELVAAGASVTWCANKSDWERAEVDDLMRCGVKIGIGYRSFAGALMRARTFDVLYCVGHSRVHNIWLTVCKCFTIYHEIVDCPQPDGWARDILPRIDVVVSNSQAVTDRLADVFPTVRVITIPFLTGEGPTQYSPKTLNSGPGSTLRLLYAGRIVAHKRPHLLVRDWDAIRRLDHLAPCCLDLYGDDKDPSLLNSIKSYIVQHDIGDEVRAWGLYRPDQLDEIMANADIVVLPSEFEGLPLVLIEAMERGVPVVATDVGGARELGEGQIGAVITAPDWTSFLSGLSEMAGRIRAGAIDSAALASWTKKKYGYEAVRRRWLGFILGRP